MVSLAVSSICARFKQKQRLGCICEFEIQAYVGSGVKKMEHVRHFFDSFFWYFHCTFIVSRNETENFKWAYLKSCILDNITGNKRFQSHFQPV